MEKSPNKLFKGHSTWSCCLDPVSSDSDSAGGHCEQQLAPDTQAFSSKYLAIDFTAVNAEEMRGAK